MRRRIALMLLSGLLWSLSFPGWLVNGETPWTGWLGWVALVPALGALEGATPGEGALAGWIGGWAGWASVLTWVLAIQELEVFRIPAWLAFAAILGGFWGGFGWLVARTGAGRALVMTPAAWTILEWGRGWLFTGFAWVPLGSSQLEGRPEVYMAARVIGILGVSLMVAMMNAAIWSFWRRPPDRVRAALVGATALLVCLALGRVGMRDAERGMQGARPLRVGLLQGAFTESEKWSLPAEVMVARYEALAREAARQGATIMVWPETATASVLNRDPVQLDRIVRLARRSGSLQLVGALEEDEMTGTLHNGITAVTGLGPVAVYRKVHLVPFGEYVPGWFRRWAPFARKLTAGLVDLTPAPALLPLRIPGGPIVAGVVCYEIVFAGLVQSLAGAGAEVIVNVTNDAWYGHSPATWQHALGVRARAVETGLWVVRCANTGASMVVDPLGRPRRTLDLFVPGVQVETVGARAISTPAVRWGALPVLAIAFALLAWVCRTGAA